MELLIYVSKITNRLFYIIELILKEELGIDFKFTTDKEKYLSYEGPKIHYGKYPLLEENGLFQQSVNLLFERDIAHQDVKICKHNDTKGRVRGHRWTQRIRKIHARQAFESYSSSDRGACDDRRGGSGSRRYLPSRGRAGGCAF